MPAIVRLGAHDQPPTEYDQTLDLDTSDAVRGLNIQPGSGTAGLTASSATIPTIQK